MRRRRAGRSVERKGGPPMNDWSFDTRAVQAGRASGPLSDPGGAAADLGRPVAPGIQPASSYAFEHLEALNRAFEDPAAGYVYGRHGNPTVDQFAGAVATLEGMDGAVAFASGMGAIHAVLLAAGVGAGESVVAGRDLYGATQTLLATI